MLEIKLNFLRDPQKIIDVEGRVVWVKRGRNYWRVGIEFKNLTEKQRILIDSYIKSLFKK